MDYKPDKKQDKYLDSYLSSSGPPDRKKSKKKSKLGVALRTVGSMTQSQGGKSSLPSRSFAAMKKTKKEGCGVEVLSISVFLLVIALLMTFANLTEAGNIPRNLKRLDINGRILGNLSKGETIFYDLLIPANTLVGISTEQATENPLDTTVALLKRPNDILRFNDDISSDNTNSFIFFETGKSDENLVVEVGSFEDAGEGSYLVSPFTVQQLLTVNEIYNQTLQVNEIFLSTIFLEAGKTYHFYAYHIRGVFDELDSAIRIRNLEGKELTEAFQSTISEFTARVLFTPEESGLFIVEVRSIARIVVDLNVLVFEAQTNALDMQFDSEKTFTGNSLLTTESTVLELALEANVQYSFDMSIELNDLPDVEDELNKFGTNLGLTVGNDTINAVVLTIGPLEALSIRFMEKKTNEILLRTRTNMTGELGNVGTILSADQVPLYDAILANLTFGDTGFDFTPDEDMIVLLDVSRMNPNYLIESNAFPQEELGTFSVTIQKQGVLSQEEIDERNSLVDVNNIFPDCEIDQTKYTIKGGCEPGIALYCRNEFAPLLNLENDTKAEFSDICDCVELLCASLPSGDDVAGGFQLFLNIFYGLFAAISMAGCVVYLFAMLDLTVYGGIDGWLIRGFYSWTICALFFLVSSIFFITQITLSTEIKNMEQISDNFDINRIPVPDDNLAYNYYDQFVATIFNVSSNVTDDYNGATFLNAEALQATPTISFSDLRSRILANMISFVFLQALAVISFLDVSVVWIETSRSTNLNRLQRERQIRRFKYLIRVVELVYFCFLFGIAVRLARTNGDSYNVLSSVLVFLFAIGVAALYVIGRLRMKAIFSMTASRADETFGGGKFWTMIRNVSTIVVVSNIGVIVVQFFFMIKVQNFQELVEARNDSVALAMLMFQHICIFAAEISIFAYLFVLYRDYRETLYEDGSEEELEENSNKLHPTMEKTTFWMETSKSSKKLKSPPSVEESITEIL